MPALLAGLKDPVHLPSLLQLSSHLGGGENLGELSRDTIAAKALLASGVQGQALLYVAASWGQVSQIIDKVTECIEKTFDRSSLSLADTTRRPKAQKVTAKSKSKSKAKTLNDEVGPKPPSLFI